MSEKALSGGFSPNKLRLRKWLRVAMSSATYYAGLNHLLGLRSSEPRVRILMYHHIAENPSSPYSVSPIAFEQQMQFLAAKCSVISLEQWMDYLSGKGSLPDKPIVITLDDGWADNYTAAYAILKKYNLPATIFVVPDWIVPPHKALRTSETGKKKQQHLSWDQIQEMSQNRISVGAHTITHRSLPTLTLEEARYELLESRLRLEQQLGHPIKFFAYPYGAIGDVNADIVRLVAECGYACAVTSLSGTNGRGANPYTLRRTEIEATDGMYVFSRAIAGGLDSWIILQWFKWVLDVLSGHALNV
jgi:peptidoglycan/xylan/chitin deacetylase (PgdA/CDA1 family)